MKGRITKLQRTGLSLLLTICLVVGLCMPSFAVTNEKHSMLDAVVADLIDLIAEYEGDMYKYAYDLAKDKGYIDDAIAYIDEIIATLESEGEAAKAELDALKEQIADAEAQIADADAKIADAEQQLADAKVQLADAKVQLADAEAKLDQAKQDLEDAKAASSPEDIAKAEADIAQADADIAKAKADIAQADADIADAEVQLADGKAQLADAKVQLADAKVQLADAEAAIDELVVEVKETLGEAKAVILEADVLDQATVDALSKLFDEAEEDMVKIDAIMEIADKAGVDPSELGALVELHDAYVVLTEDLIPLIENDVLPIVLDAQEYVQDKLEAAMAELGVTYDDAAEKIPQLVYDATHGVYEITDKSHYVALGGATAYGLGCVNGKTYSELFAEHLGLQDSYVDLTDDELDITGAVQNIKDNAAEIAKADIITYQMDVYMFMLAAMEGNVDWSKYIADAEILEMVEDAKQAAIDELSKELDAKDVADAAEQVEQILYAFVAYGFENANAIKEIKAINSDAVIVMLGMYNPLQGLTVEVEGTVIDVSNMFENLMIATDVNNLIFSMTSGGIVFVEISMAEADGFDPIVVDPENLDAVEKDLLKILNNMDNMCANAEGHEYIYNQILDALEIIRKQPETGDNTNIGMWITISALCAVAFVGLVGYNKAKNCAK